MTCRSLLLRFATTAIVLGAALAGVGCAHGTNGDISPSSSRVTDEVAVNAALQHYAMLVLQMDHVGITALFAPNGELVNPGQTPIQGRPAIAVFLAGFSEYHVLENTIVPSRTHVHGNTAEQDGTYHQRVRTPSGQVVEVSGGFQARWVRTHSDEWQLQRMATTPSR